LGKEQKRRRTITSRKRAPLNLGMVRDSDKGPFGLLPRELKGGKRGEGLKGLRKYWGEKRMNWEKKRGKGELLIPWGGCSGGRVPKGGGGRRVSQCHALGNIYSWGDIKREKELGRG